MKKVKVIKPTNLPARMPIHTTAIAYLLLDKFNAVEWVWGVAITIICLWWLLFFFVIANEERIDLLKEKK